MCVDDFNVQAHEVVLPHAILEIVLTRNDDSNIETIHGNDVFSDKNRRSTLHGEKVPKWSDTRTMVLRSATQMSIEEIKMMDGRALGT